MGLARSAKMALAPGQNPSRQAASWLLAAMRWSTRSLAGADHRAQGAGLGRERLQDPQAMGAQPQVLGDQGGVAGVVLGARQHLGVAPGLDGVGLDRHDRVAGFQQPVDQPPVGAFDGHRQPGRLAVAAPGGPPAGRTRRRCGRSRRRWPWCRRRRARRRHGVRTPNRSRQNMSPPRGGSDGSVRRAQPGRSLTGALGRVPLLPVTSPRGAGGGGVMPALAGATEPGRHPSAHRSRTTKTMPVPVNKRVDQ